MNASLGYLNKLNENKYISKKDDKTYFIAYIFSCVLRVRCEAQTVRRCKDYHTAVVSECPPPSTRTHTLTAESNYLQS